MRSVPITSVSIIHAQVNTNSSCKQSLSVKPTLSTVSIIRQRAQLGLYCFFRGNNYLLLPV